MAKHFEAALDVGGNLDVQVPEKGDGPMGDVIDLMPGSWRQRCTAKAKSTGNRCARWAVRGMTVCPMHGGGGKVKHPDDPKAESHPRTNAAMRIEAVKERLTELGDQALATVSEVLTGHVVVDGVEIPVADAKDRLKAAEMVLDRMVGRKIETSQDTEEHGDMDSKIEAVLERLGVDKKEAG